MPHPIYISHTSQILPEDPFLYKELIGVVFINQLPPICFWENHFAEGVYCISKFILFNKMTMFLLVISTLYVLRKMNLCKKKMLWENLRHDSRSFVSVVIILNDLLFYIKLLNPFISKDFNRSELCLNIKRWKWSKMRKFILSIKLIF